MKKITTFVLISIVLGIPVALFVPDVIAIVVFYGSAALLWFFLTLAPPKPLEGWEARRGELVVVVSLALCVIVTLMYL